MITEPYIFISYAHADAARLDPIIEADAALSGVAFLEENAEYSTYKTLGSAARALTVIIDKQAGAVCAIELQTDLPLY